LTRSTLLLSSSKLPTQDAPISFRVDTDSEINALVILDSSLLKTHDLISGLQEGAPILISTPWTPEEVISNLSPTNLQNIISKNSQLLTIDVESLAGKGNNQDIAYAIATSVFLRLYLGPTAKRDVVMQLAASFFGPEIQGVSIEDISQKTWDGLRKIVLPSNQSTEETVAPAKTFSFNAASLPNIDVSPATSAIRSTSWSEAGKSILFREAFCPTPKIPQSSQFIFRPDLRPDILDDTFLVTCRVNRRLTPLEYNRNVFHLEFDTSGTGLKYEIGEALGVHGWNDTEEVLDFCSWYGLNSNDVISIPIPGDPGKRHLRTIFQAFQQQIDIFGKPPKGFYEVLSGHATNREDRMALRFISAAEGSSTFKKLSELETVTFADVLKKFSSARPPVELLCEIIGDIKPRHYSIASAQSAVGDRVDLLVVTVDWVTLSGEQIFKLGGYY
jgi:sulfite reductase (NADPH) flavoprotein alpha-component